MTTLSKNARIAGLLYFGLTLTGPVRLIYIPSVLFVSGSAAATAHNIASHDLLFRAGIFADLLSGVLNVFLALALYRLLAGVDRALAVTMVILGGILSVPIYFLNTLNDVGALLFAHGTDSLSAFSRPQQEAMTMLFVNLHHYGVLVNEVFWGLWLLPFGLLVYKSDFLPRILGVWLVVNCFAYLAQVVSGVLLPQFSETVANIALPVQFGEVAIMLWLIVIGAKRRVAAAGPRLASP